MCSTWEDCEAEKAHISHKIYHIKMRVVNMCCQCPCLSFTTTSPPSWNGEESRKSPHPYWPWHSINKSWSIAHEAQLWQPSTHWSEFTDINISLPDTHLPSATIYDLCHSCSTFWQTWNHTEGSTFSTSKLNCHGRRDTLSGKSLNSEVTFDLMP